MGEEKYSLFICPNFELIFLNHDVLIFEPHHHIFGWFSVSNYGMAVFSSSYKVGPTCGWIPHFPIPTFLRFVSLGAYHNACGILMSVVLSGEAFQPLYIDN